MANQTYTKLFAWILNKKIRVFLFLKAQITPHTKLIILEKVKLSQHYTAEVLDLDNIILFPHKLHYHKTQLGTSGILLVNQIFWVQRQICPGKFQFSMGYYILLFHLPRCTPDTVKKSPTP